MTLNYSGTLGSLYFGKPLPFPETVTFPKWMPVLATEVQLASFIFLKFFDIRPWEIDLPRKTYTAHRMFNGNFLAQENAGFACFCTVLKKTEKPLPFWKRFLCRDGPPCWERKEHYESFISRGFNISSWGCGFAHKTSVVRGRSTAAFLRPRNARFTKFPQFRKMQRNYFHS